MRVFKSIKWFETIVRYKMNIYNQGTYVSPLYQENEKKLLISRN